METLKSMPLPERDVLWRFVLERSGVRGLLVRLDETWLRVRSGAEYPDALAVLLGQSLAAAALFTGHVKMQGRLSIQFRAQGPVPRVFAECSHQGRLRGIAQWQGALPDPLDLSRLGTSRVLAITIESDAAPGREPHRYQGLVPLEGERVDQAFEAYFDRSEQLPTRLLLAADRAQAAGLMLQRLPDGKDSGDGWATAQALFDTLGERELLDSDPQSLLFRLFNEEGIRVLDTRLLGFGCSCSRERVADVLRSLGREEAFAAAEGRDRAEVRCEFCGTLYGFDRVDLGQLFGDAGPAPSAVQ